MMEPEKAEHKNARKSRISALSWLLASVFLSLLCLAALFVGGNYLLGVLGLNGPFSWVLSGVFTAAYMAFVSLVALVARRLRDVYSPYGIKFALREPEIPWSGATGSLGPAVARLIARSS
ncbi:hypothetical protein [Streptomyces sp. NPDC004250]|uniref:hypothetical protein n=1 Tax=Streptomyces sp. NPDC004250 TaxID=3364692 RepID=UPI0036A8C255